MHFRQIFPRVENAVVFPNRFHDIYFIIMGHPENLIILISPSSYKKKGGEMPSEQRVLDSKVMIVI